MSDRRYPKAELAREAVRRFGHLENRAIARHLMATHPAVFDNDLEKARSAVRRVTGHAGESAKTRMRPETFRETPVRLPKNWVKPRRDYSLAAGLWGVMSDVHIPMHETTPIETAVEWFLANKIEGLLLNGDIWDAASVGFWPTAHRDFDREMQAMADFLDFLATAFPGVKIVYKPGNHEFRLPRKFVSALPELIDSPMAALETVLGFEWRGIEYLEYKQKVKAGGLNILHGDEIAVSTAVNPARGVFLKAQAACLIGHCHRTSEHTEPNLNGDVVTTWSTGCMCDLSPDYAPYNKWNWGAALVNVENPRARRGGYEVENRRILPNGKLK